MTISKTDLPLHAVLERIHQARGTINDANSFEGEIVALLALEDGKLLLGIQLEDAFVLARVTSDLELDTSFGADHSGYVWDLFDDADWGYSAVYGLLRQDDHILLTGEYFDFREYRSRAALARYTKDGIVDTGFADDGKLVIELPEARQANRRGILHHARQILTKATQPAPAGQVTLVGDKIVIVLLDATFDNSNGTTQLIRLNYDGSFDLGFNGQGFVHVTVGGREINPGGVRVLANECLLVYGGTQPADDGAYAVLARYTTDGSPDPSFNATISPGFIAIGEAGLRARFGALHEDQGQVFALGDISGDGLMAHIQSDGTPAPDFNDGIPLRFPLPGNTLDKLHAVQPQRSHLVAAGSVYPSGGRRGLVMRLTRAGELDAEFAGGAGFSVDPQPSEYFDVAISPEETILTGGYCNEHTALKDHGTHGLTAQDLGKNSSASTEFRATPARKSRRA